MAVQAVMVRRETAMNRHIRMSAVVCALSALVAGCVGDPPMLGGEAMGASAPRNHAHVDAYERRAVLENAFANLMASIEEEEVAAIRAVLEGQQAAWNAGDVDAFMEGYWRSENLRFASGGTVTRGWAETLHRYQVRYPDRAAMGVLSFDDLDIVLTAPDAGVVFGHWSLAREADAPGGLFTLIFRKIDGVWVVVHDHTSAE